uniref:N-acetylgalactosaminide beta-1,3-galactosyltransferase n=1 Tax=Rhabditophanes sp. KR3021 TaxID=114890 RepID=A0AC35TI88_9BILA
MKVALLFTLFCSGHFLTRKLGEEQSKNITVHEEQSDHTIISEDQSKNTTSDEDHSKDIAIPEDHSEDLIIDEDHSENITIAKARSKKVPKHQFKVHEITLFDDDGATEKFQDKLFHDVTIFCLVLSGKGFKTLRDDAIKATWLRKCNKYIFVSSVEEEDTLKATSQHGYEYSYHKMKFGLKWIWKNYPNKYDWIYKVDDDAYAVMENLRMFLVRRDPNKAYQDFGFRARYYDHEHLIKEGFIHGGSGAVFSKASLKKLITKGFPNLKVCRAANKQLEDQELSQCLSNLNIKPTDSRDYLQRHLFISSSISDISSPTSILYWPTVIGRSIYPVAKGTKYLATYPVVFHRVSRTNVYVYEYVFNYAYVAGRRTSMFLNNTQPIVEQVEDTFSLIQNFAKYNY